MSKNVSINEGAVAREFGPTEKLEMRLKEGGTCLWVPEDETQTGSIYAYENREYLPSEIGKYGISEATVSVALKGDDGSIAKIDENGQPRIEIPDIEVPDFEYDDQGNPQVPVDVPKIVIDFDENGVMQITPFEIDPVTHEPVAQEPIAFDMDDMGYDDTEPITISVNNVSSSGGSGSSSGGGGGGGGSGGGSSGGGTHSGSGTSTKVNVTVSGKNTSGNAQVSVINGKGVKETVALPSKIVVETGPLKFTYRDGEVIDFFLADVMVVKAYMEDGTLWTDSNHPDGVIPYSELQIDPPRADINKCGELIYSKAGINMMELTFTNIPQNVQAESYYGDTFLGNGIYPLIIGLGKPITFAAHKSIKMLLTRYNDGLYGCIKEGEGGVKPNGYFFYGGEWGLAWGASGMFTNRDRIYSYSGNSYCDWSNVPKSTVNPEYASPDGLHLVGGSQGINLTWRRPVDSMMLTTTYDIIVLIGEGNVGG